MEPLPETFEEIGRLCTSWAYLESVTEQTVWGVLGVDINLGRFITWRLDLRSRWQLILEQAPNKHSAEDVTALRAINKDVSTVARDRNIIVHGSMHTLVDLSTTGNPDYGKDFANLGETFPVARVPCWTVFRGADVGKYFPVSKKAVEIARRNILTTAKHIVQFNKKHRYTSPTIVLEPHPAETEWPKPL
jgi:hypothetical protein